jgi:hypothetical protein
MRVLLDSLPFTDLPEDNGLWGRGRWPAEWIAPTLHARLEPQALAWRRRFTLAQARTLRIHVSADERYELFLDGERIGRGPERGDLDHWFFESHDLELAAGEHLLVARTWWLGPQAPMAQFTKRPAFLLAGEGVAPELLNTGRAAWEVATLDGYEWLPALMTWGAGGKVLVHGDRFSWGFELGLGAGWKPAVPIGTAGCGQRFADGGLGWFLRAAVLPPMLERTRPVGEVRHVEALESLDTAKRSVHAQHHLPAEALAWQALLGGTGAVTIPPRSIRRVIVDLRDYLTAYPELTLSGGAGATVRVHWAEGLFLAPGHGHGPKGNRDEIEGKVFIGNGDTVVADGGAARRFDTPWWAAGRYVEVLVATADQPLTIDALRLTETHYPYRWDCRFEAADPRLAQAIAPMLRTLEACSHETYMDCPYYEQLMYVGDTRLEALTTYAATRDARLPRKAIELFDWSRQPSGLTESRYPSFNRQMIPPFSLWWVGMVRDWLWWRDDAAFTRERMAGVRGVIEAFMRERDARGLIRGPEGWNYMDWVPAWTHGMPPDGDIGQASGPLNWQAALALRDVVELEQALGEHELAARAERQGRELAAALDAAMWDDRRGLYADDAARTSFSEHAQCLALLSGFVPEARRARIAKGLVEASDLHRTTIYFSHYMFETYRLLGRIDLLIARMGLWFALPSLGLKTTLEAPEPSRSDCHAWGAHPLYHYLATILGIRPAAAGFARVRIEPQLGPLAWAKGAMAHPRGEIAVELRQENARLRGTITLPDGVAGTLVLEGREQPLSPGRNAV